MRYNGGAREPSGPAKASSAAREHHPPSMDTTLDEGVATEPIVVFDADCPLCVSACALFARLGLVPRARQMAWQELDGALAERVWEAGIRNEMVVLGPDTGELRTGAGGILWAFEPSWARPIARLLGARPFARPVSFLYHVISYNRRILAPVPRTMSCDCDPDFHAGYRSAFMVLCGVYALALIVLLGGTVDRIGGPGWAVPVVVLAAWGPLLLPLFPWTRPRSFDWLAHVLMTLAAGLTLTLPAALAAALFDGGTRLFVQGATLLLAATWTFVMLRRRVVPVDLSTSWPVLWGACLASGVVLATAVGSSA